MAEGAGDPVEQAMDWVEDKVLPSLAVLVDALREASGEENRRAYAQTHAADLRTIAAQLDELMRELERYRDATAAESPGRDAA